MGAWSHEPLGNDTANDWAAGLEDENDLAYIEEALDRVLESGEDYLDAPDAEEAVAAAETLAWLRGHGTQRDSYTEKLDEWAQRVDLQPGPALLQKARQALQRILSDNSELRELWEEGEDAGAWMQSLTQLQQALAG